LPKRITGSGDRFNKRCRKPWSSVNFVTAHDGFNLNDLVSYNDKHNEANGEDNRDGHSNNHSWNHGIEGRTDDPEISALRERQKRNFLATIVLLTEHPCCSAAMSSVIAKTAPTTPTPDSETLEFFSNLIFLHVLVVSLRWIDQREQSFVASQIDAGPYLFILAVGK
jgi:hypothetical protein